MVSEQKQTGLDVFITVQLVGKCDDLCHIALFVIVLLFLLLYILYEKRRQILLCLPNSSSSESL